MKRYFVLTAALLLNILARAQKIENLAELKQKSANPIFSRLDAAPRGGGFSMKGYWVWCGSAVKGDDNKYHLFASRWPDSLVFHPGWMVASEVVHAVADRPEGPYTFSDVALPARGAQYWDGRATHNPQIVKHKGQYILFYMGSTHPFSDPPAKELTLSSYWCIAARNNKRVGVAVSNSPYGPWKRLDQPVLPVKPNTFYSFLTSNPTAVVHEDGSVLIMFKGRGHKGNTHSHMSLGVAKAPSIYGPYKVLNNDQPIFSVDTQGEAEDPFMWKDAAGYHIIFKDQVAKFTGEKGGGVLAHSKDGVKWVIDKDPKAYSRTVAWNDGKTDMQGQLERPFILFENQKPAYLFFATMDGPGGFNNATRSWNMVIPFKR